MMTKQILEQAKNKKNSGAKIVNDDDTLGENIKKRVIYLTKSASPGFATQIYDLLESWQPDTFLNEEELKYMKKSFLHEAMSFTGNRFSRFNIQENFKYGVKEAITNLNNTKPKEKEEITVFNRVKRQMEYLDKLYLYSEFFGIETEGVKKSLMKSMDDRFDTNQSNRDNIISQYVRGYGFGNEIYN
jgi:hypothetical protein